ncbi:SusC/RagA family TonB-linked outer membrane protein [Sphingobacterium alkalisoli]|uniref:SusC/RagA family TonB-linked outer membrane protein n=2 Tax=Sphingobacterium alkalisoli TaxID=1874115 RepID=A0A4U0GY57_9SPHI|nr:SusC/RagA family TonB-linked outer membrane protein [Sphingobacterium alkalisoli]GGH28745.1 SusC/RagA family TonB-linked outer membrane protein [Sphingobacterium alkalisoli]
MIYAAQLNFASAFGGQNIENTQVTLSKNNYLLQELILILENQTDFSLLYNADVLALKASKPIPAGTKSVKKLLKEIEDHYTVVYKIDGQVITLRTDKTARPPQQQRRLSGKVTDRNSNPLPNVTVAVKGKSGSVETNGSGQYSIDVEEGQVLVFSYLGFEPIEKAIGRGQILDVILDEKAQLLEEMVVTALGIKREEKALGYAVQKVEGATLQTVKGVDVATSLTGKVSGLMIRNSTEFTEEPAIQLRGESPLLVIDGVPYGNMTLRDIPADDIETIDVLKGPTASALYGYRGASGAIVVTTKKGSAAKGLRVELNSSTMFTSGYLAIPEMQSVYGRQIDAATNRYTGTGSWGVPMEGQEVVQWDPIGKEYKAMPYLPIGKDNFKNFLEQGYITNNHVSVTQQGELGNVRSSVNWMNNKGQYPNSRFDKYTYTLAGDINLDRFKLSSSVSINRQSSPNKGFSGYTGYDPMYSLLVWSAPDFDVRNYKDYWLVPNESQNNSYTGTNNNPYFDRFERVHAIDRNVFNGFVSASYQVTPWLNAMLRTGFDTYNNKQVIRISRGSLTGAGVAKVIVNGTEIWGESLKGSYNEGIGNGYSLNSDVMLNANKRFGDFELDGLVGGTIYYTEDEGIEARTQGGLSVPGFYSLKASVTNALVNTQAYKRQVNSVFGKLSASWRNMAFVEGTLRNDWSSTLPSSTRSYLYPSLSGSFLASEVIPKSDWMSFWKFRGSWTSSKTPANIYDINSAYNITTNAWGSLNSASFPETIRGTMVRPESSETWEVGTAARLFKNILSLDFTYYSKRMFDFLRATNVSNASGFNGNYINTNEEITRRGVELTANVTAIKTTDWQWDITANWSQYARYYTQLDEEFSVDRPWVQVGKRVDAYVLNDFLKDAGGNVIYESGLPVYSPYQSVFGYSDPGQIWGLASSVRYKDFSLALSVDGRIGGLAQTTTEMYMWQSGNHPNSVNDTRYLDVTTGTANYVGDGVKVISGNVAYDVYGNITSDTRQYAPNDVPVTYENYVKRIHKGTAWGGAPSPMDTYSTTFLKLREVSVTYRIPQSMSKFVGARGASVSAIGQNLFLWAKDFKYSDPDGGMDNFSDPSQRYIGFNIKVDF